MKILLLNSLWGPIEDTPVGGIEAFILRVADLLIEKGHDVTLFGTRDSNTQKYKLGSYGEYSKNHYNIYEKGRRLNYSVIRDNVSSYLKDNKPDLILLNFFNTRIMEVISESGIKCINIVHQYPYGISAIAEIEGLAKFNSGNIKCVTVSKHMADRLNSSLLAVSGFISPYFTNKDNIKMISPGFGMASVVSRISHDKGFDLTIDSLIKAGIKGRFVGRCNHYNEKDEKLLEKFTQYVAQSNSIWTQSAPNSDTMNIIAKSSFLIEGDTMSAFSTVTAEAICNGVPVICTSGITDGPYEIMTNLNTNLIYCPQMYRFSHKKRVDTVVECMKSALEVSLSDRIKISTIARDFYSPDKWYDRFMELVGEL